MIARTRLMKPKIKEHGKMAKDTVFVDGLFFKFVGPYGEKPDGTPKFVLSRASINCKKLTAFMRQHHNDGWVNFDILLSKDEKKVYPKLDTYKKESKGDDWGTPPAPSVPPPPEDITDYSEPEDIPF